MSKKRLLLKILLPKFMRLGFSFIKEAKRGIRRQHLGGLRGLSHRENESDDSLVVDKLGSSTEIEDYIQAGAKIIVTKNWTPQVG